MIPDGMMEVFTVERPVTGARGSAVLIDDLKLTAEEADAEVGRRGFPWRSLRLVVPVPDGGWRP